MSDSGLDPFGLLTSVFTDLFVRTLGIAVDPLTDDDLDRYSALGAAEASTPRDQFKAVRNRALREYEAGKDNQPARDTRGGLSVRKIALELLKPGSTLLPMPSEADSEASMARLVYFMHLRNAEEQSRPARERERELQSRWNAAVENTPPLFSVSASSVYTHTFRQMGPDGKWTTETKRVVRRPDGSEETTVTRTDS